ncbi:hypothetical protein HN011_009110, partial [Eciton burchellii]
SLHTTAEKYATVALLAGDLLTAEGILLQNSLVKKAICTNVETYNWNRALELAIKHKHQVEEQTFQHQFNQQINNKKSYMEDDTEQNYN